VWLPRPGGAPTSFECRAILQTTHWWTGAPTLSEVRLLPHVPQLSSARPDVGGL